MRCSRTSQGTFYPQRSSTMTPIPPTTGLMGPQDALGSSPQKRSREGGGGAGGVRGDSSKKGWKNRLGPQ